MLSCNRWYPNRPHFSYPLLLDIYLESMWWWFSGPNKTLAPWFTVKCLETYSTVLLPALISPTPHAEMWGIPIACPELPNTCQGGIPECLQNRCAWLYFQMVNERNTPSFLLLLSNIYSQQGKCLVYLVWGYISPSLQIQFTLATFKFSTCCGIRVSDLNDIGTNDVDNNEF